MSRNLLLVGKVIQNIANFVQYDKKESYLSIVSDFTYSKFSEMRDFIDSFCIAPSEAIDSILTIPVISFGREMSMIHYYVQTLIPLLKEEYGKEDQDVIDLENAIDKINIDIEKEKEKHTKSMTNYKNKITKKRKRYFSTSSPVQIDKIIKEEEDKYEDQVFRSESQLNVSLTIEKEDSSLLVITESNEEKSI